MNLLVTGASGRIGRYIVRDLADAGHRVLGVDLGPAATNTVPHMRLDLTDAGQIYQALAKVQADAVVHMGAWADAGIVADTRTYGDNVRGTYNLFQACADMGIKRIVSASSNQVYGLAYAPPLYAPVDEEHPLRPGNSYALSKAAGEQAAEYFIQNHSLEILSFRIMGTRVPTAIAAEIEAIAAEPQKAAGLLWTRTDARDVATACRLAVEADQIEAGPYHITGPRVALDVDSAELLQRYCPSTAIRPGLEGVASPLSCAKAHRVFGYKPQYAWSLGQSHPE
jgi:nucleoside-diphosphate-sugar epimerase